MEVFVSAPSFSFSNLQFPDGSVVRDVLVRFAGRQGGSEDLYVVRDGRRAGPEDPLQAGAVYRLQPRLLGGKGGFGSMLRALGAQIEKTTNREACRDLSGRRLRDVNHEKEMAEWLKKQAEREAEKEQRRAERLQRKLAEPAHHFTDAEYRRQCHDLSERLEDSVIKGLQASSSSQVKVDDVAAATKRPNAEPAAAPRKKKQKTAAPCFWTGVDELLSSEDDEDEEDEESPSTSSSSSSRGAAAVTMTTHVQEPEPSSSSSDCSSSSEDQRPAETPTDLSIRAPVDQRPAETPTDLSIKAPVDQRPAETPTDLSIRAPVDQRPAETPTDLSIKAPVDQRPAETPTDLSIRAPVDQRPAEMSATQTVPSLEDQRPAETSRDLQTGPPEAASRSVVDLSSVSSVDQLESLGLDVLKEELLSRGLKCGGTLADRAARLFSVRGLRPDQIEPALLAKASKTKRK